MQELQRTPLAEEVGILAASDLALRFVEWFGFKELARTGARVNKRWHAASLVFAPPEADFRQRPGPREIFDGFIRLSAWSDAHSISHAHQIVDGQAVPGSTHPSVANPIAARFDRCFQNGCGAYVIDAGNQGGHRASIPSFASFVEFLIRMNVGGQILVTMRAEDLASWVRVFQGKPYYRGDPAADDDFQPAWDPPAGQMRVYLWPHEQVEQWGDIDSARWKIVVVDIGADALLNSTLTRSGTLERLAQTAQDKYLMCRCVPIAVEEMLLRGMFVARLAFTPMYNAFTEYFGGLLIVSRPDRRDTPEKRYLVELLRRDLKTYLAAEFPQTVHVRYSRLTAGPSRPQRPRSRSEP